MKRLLLLALVYLLAVTSHASAEIRGTWTATTSERSDGKVHLNISASPHNQLGQTMRLSDFSGLSTGQTLSASQAPVTFELRRDAGRLAFRGFFENGEGAGHFTFTPDSSYISRIESLGVEVESKMREEKKLLTLAVLDVSPDFIRDMRAEGYNLDLDDYLSMRIFSVSKEVLDEYRRYGYDRIPHKKLISLRVHGATPKYLHEMKAAGFPNISLDDAISSRVHGATPEYVAEMRALGFGVRDLDDLISFRIHGVTPKAIREFHEAGYTNLSPREVMQMRIHGATPEFARELKELGYTGITASKLVEMRIHGVTTKFIRELRDAGYSGIPVDKLIQMRIHGISPEFVRRVQR